MRFGAFCTTPFTAIHGYQLSLLAVERLLLPNHPAMMPVSAQRAALGCGFTPKGNDFCHAGQPLSLHCCSAQILTERPTKFAGLPLP